MLLCVSVERIRDRSQTQREREREYRTAMSMRWILIKNERFSQQTPPLRRLWLGCAEVIEKTKFRQWIVNVENYGKKQSDLHIFLLRLCWMFLSVYGQFILRL